VQKYFSPEKLYTESEAEAMVALLAAVKILSQGKTQSVSSPKGADSFSGWRRNRLSAED
jgi:hypothetical protein